MKSHLVRGIVRSADLADDLVGPSAALTKLRTNIYDAEDTEWKEVKVFKSVSTSSYLTSCFVKVLTVNGAKVTKRDIEANNGIIHVVDRVLFPPTVGDLVETLKVFQIL